MQYKKPSYVAEFGIGDEVSWLCMIVSLTSLCSTIHMSLNHLTQSQDKAGVSLHNGVWAPLFSLGAGTCM